MNNSSSDDNSSVDNKHEHGKHKHGKRGPRGKQGKQGERGQKGDRGDRGQQGERGERGYDGKRGPRGERGKRGFRGASLVWKGPWDPTVKYEENDIVQYNGGSTYIAIDNNCNAIPEADSVYWELFVPAGANGTDGVNGTDGTNGTNGTNGLNGTSFIWRGPWTGELTYVINDVVEYNGSSYIAISDNINLPPPSISWNLMAAKGSP
jgi:hypothetical protein